MSQADLGRTGVVASPSTISKWVRGDQAPTDVETVISVAHALRERDSIAALRAAGLHRAADAIASEISAAAEDPMIARIRRADLPPHIKDQMERDYLRRHAENVRFFELEFAAALRDLQGGKRRRTTADHGETNGPDRTAL